MAQENLIQRENDLNNKPATFRSVHSEAELVEERPLSPGLVARITESTCYDLSPMIDDDEDYSDRTIRRTEANRINEALSNVWPG